MPAPITATYTVLQLFLLAECRTVLVLVLCIEYDVLYQEEVEARARLSFDTYPHEEREIMC